MHLGNSISSKENCLEETLFRKIENSIERLEYMKKIFLNVLSVLMVILAVSCSAAMEEAARGDLRIRIVEFRSVMPQYPEVDSYSVSLTDGPQTVGPQTFGVDDDIVIKDILVGSYTLTVEGLEDNLPVLSNTQTVKISPNRTDVAITLDFLSEGTGTVIIPISWADVSNPSQLLEAAIANKDLGFQAFFTADNTPLTEKIQWATEEDFENKSMTYTAEGINKTENASVYFKIFMQGDDGSEPFAVARAFDTKITVYPNLTSTPDGNESENFTIGDSTIDYIFNVQNPKSVATPGHEATSVDITWEYPNLWGTYSGKVIVRLLASDGSDINKTQEAAFSNEDKSNNKVAFDNLDATETYKVSFQIVLDDGGVSEEEILLNNVHVEASVTSISFTGLNDSYVMGDSAELEVTVLPEHAVDKTYTITHNGNDGDITIVGNKLTFNRSGDYTINVKSNDKTVVEEDERLSADSITVTVKLAAPSSFKAENGDDGIVLTWDAVDSADGYKITRTENNSATKGGEEVITGTRYEDTAGIRLSTKYDYTIQAVRNDEDGKFNSTTSSANITTLEPSVSIELPSKDIFNTENLTPFLSGIKSQVLTTENQIAIQIKSPIEGATYTWYLNGHKIEDSSTDFIISVENYGNYLKGLSAVTENTLRLEVSKGGKTSSGTTTFLFATVISNADITGITVTEGDANKVVLGSPITLNATISDNSNPEIRWTSSDENVATVDQTGVVTAVNDGKATITAEIISNGSKESIDVTTYIPAENVVITNETGRDFMFMRKDGVTVESGFDTVTLKAVATRNDDLTISEAAKVITWSESSESINLSSATGETVNVTSVDKTSGGDFQILAETADVKNTSTTVHVHDMDIYMKETSQGDESYNKVTGSTQNTSAIGRKRNYNLKLVYAASLPDVLHDNNSNGLNVVWCFDNDENKTQIGRYFLGDFYLTLFNPIIGDSDFTAELERDMSTADSGLVTAILKVGTAKACTISFTAGI